jgi:hypothetical protein
MALITTRQTGTTGVNGVTRKNAPLTNTEIDNNFISLNNNKLELSGATATNLTLLGTTNLQQTVELLNTKTSATGTVVHDFSTGAIFYHTSISSNFTANFTNVPTTNNRATAVSLILSQGATPRIPSALQINSSNVTILWQDNSIPTGNANKVDLASFTLIRVNTSWIVLGALNTYG